LLPDAGAIADLGSGAGFPGLVLAAAAPDREIHLVESDRRKAAFLIEAARLLGLSRLRVHATRIEAASLPPVASVTARALAPLPALLSYAAPLLAPDGVAVFPKGRSAEAELTDAIRHWTMTVERFQSRTDPEATILRLSDIHRAAAGHA
jgi:16S rRNA (guanine(527)-N(7))-methyltransferase RsmG